MLYKIKIDQSIGLYNGKKVLVSTYSNKKIRIKLENNVSVYFKGKERMLHIKFLGPLSLNIKENFLKKILARLTIQIKKIKDAINHLKKEPKCLVFLIGLGNRFELLQDSILLKLGFSHTIKVLVPTEIQVFRPKETILVLKSMSMEKLHIFTQVLKKYKKPDPYKNKGIRLNWYAATNKKFMKKG